MKRDMDLIRTLLLELEKHDTVVFASDLSVDGYDNATISGHVLLLLDEDYIEGRANPVMGGLSDPSINRITSRGHDYINAVRDDAIWARTKAAGNGVATWSLDTAKLLASGYIRQLIKSKTGVEI